MSDDIDTKDLDSIKLIKNYFNANDLKILNHIIVFEKMNELW